MSDTVAGPLSFFGSSVPYNIAGRVWVEGPGYLIPYELESSLNYLKKGSIGSIMGVLKGGY